jgi:hypothetical protein
MQIHPFLFQTVIAISLLHQVIGAPIKFTLGLALG